MAWDKLTLVTKTLPWFLPYLLRASIHRITALFHKYSYKPTENAKHVVVVGGSFAGLQLVRHLTESLPTGYKVVWIEKNSHLNFVFAFPRFSVVSGYEERAFIPYEGVENTAPKGILTRIQDRVVEVCDGCVKLASGDSVEYAYLAIATGATRALPGQVVATERVDGAEELRGVQSVIKESRRIAVVGAGAVGVELAADIKDVFPDKEVTLVHSRDGVLNRFGKRLQEYTLSTLREVLNVRVLLNERPKIPRGEALVKAATLQFSDGREEEFDLIIRCTGQIPNSSMLAPLYPTAISPSTSQILVKPTFQIDTSPSDSIQMSTSDPRIFAFGDVAAHPGPLMARAGFIQSETVAVNILSLVKGQEAKAVYTPNMFVEGSIKLTLGKKRSVIYSSDVDGTEVLIEMGGAPEDMDVGRAWSQFGGVKEGKEKGKVKGN
ncbi:hypothetical protein ASPVEDRAFT_142636 [Aspergillus versicolor CBS 583.65]|uniref:FAD/NAD(P)-binding domain-containing protein n=1 Tax=Aspergillus versicolor CBS 583.65 TaxID=1036611 RepID=A0A1L9Q0U4_ASPVE|nr:uncharacterized protein ASPVEDRAFT_142636 [Aspergillus versicolor CBS 583.65]OJJ07398.1 hypothetical protein ASPVEDRAFT_142636 [Aspergillus versicolor CBS 583.65]